MTHIRTPLVLDITFKAKITLQIHEHACSGFSTYLLGDCAYIDIDNKLFLCWV